jgi:hypothetical protein
MGCLRHDAVVIAADAIYVAASSGELLRVVGSRIYTIVADMRAKALAWVAGTDELWVATDKSTTMVVTPQRQAHYRRSFGPINGYYSVGNTVYAHTANGLYDIGRETDVDTVDVAWTVRVAVDYRKRPQWFALDLQSPDSDLTVSLRADNGAGIAHSYPITTLQLLGPINAPLLERTVAPSRRWLSLDVRGVMAPAGTLGRWTINLVGQQNE